MVSLLADSMAVVGVVPPPQFNCVASQATTLANVTDVAIPDATAGPTLGDPDTPGAQVTSTITVAGSPASSPTLMS